MAVTKKDPEREPRTHEVEITLTGEGVRNVCSTLDGMAKDLISEGEYNPGGNRAAAHLLMTSAAIEEAFGEEGE